MAAKKKSTQTDEPVVVEEEVEETQAAPPDPAPADTGQKDEEQKDTNVTDNPESAPETEPEPEIETPVQEPKMEEQQTSDTQGSSPSDFFGTPEPKSGGGFPKAILAALALLLVAGGVAGFMFLKSGGQFLGANVEATPTPLVEETPAPEPSPGAEDVNLAEFSVQVLNGSGTAGEAGKVQKLLQAAGFKEVDTGNAKAQTAKVTTISAKADVPAGALKAIENALEGSFKTEVGDALDDDSLFDIVVTTGGASAKDATGSAKEE